VLPKNGVCKNKKGAGKEYILMGPNKKELVHTVYPMCMQKLNLNEFKAIFEKLCQS
jgi:hypothetical protein